MAIDTRLHESGSIIHEAAGPTATSPSAARLIAALSASPRLTNEDAAYTVELIADKREDSATDKLSD
jgi:hypothetical protein